MQCPFNSPFNRGGVHGHRRCCCPALASTEKTDLSCRGRSALRSVAPAIWPTSSPSPAAAAGPVGYLQRAIRSAIGRLFGPALDPLRSGRDHSVAFVFRCSVAYLTVVAGVERFLSASKKRRCAKLATGWQVWVTASRCSLVRLHVRRRPLGVPGRRFQHPGAPRDPCPVQHVARRRLNRRWRRSRRRRLRRSGARLGLLFRPPVLPAMGGDSDPLGRGKLAGQPDAGEKGMVYPLARWKTPCLGCCWG